MATTHRGTDVEFHLRPGLTDENFVAEAIGNLAAFRLQAQRAESLSWQVVRVEAGRSHHFRLVLVHPDRVLDVGIGHDLRLLLNSLSRATTDQLREQFRAAERAGLRPTALRQVHESIDFWNDDFWKWFG